MVKKQSIFVEFFVLYPTNRYLCFGLVTYYFKAYYLYIKRKLKILVHTQLFHYKLNTLNLKLVVVVGFFILH